MVFIHMYIGPQCHSNLTFALMNIYLLQLRIQNQKGYLTSYDLFQTPLDQYKKVGH